MHIPDGYLSPVTDGVMLAAAAPFWTVALKKVRKSLNQRTVPVLALFAAFSFVTMMFNVPLPGGTTAHAVGGTLLAIVLGPWAAVIGISVVLGIQALFFGDGGTLAYGANCFNMAIVLPLVGYFVYRLVSSNAEASSPRRLLGAVLGSYAGINAAALFTAVELGLQPLLFHAADGTPLYAPYNLATALPSVMAGHLLVAGPAEALVTGLVVFYLQRSRSSLLVAGEPSKKEGRRWWLWGALAALALATPIGLLASGTAWGEWGLEELKGLGLGFIPQGLSKFEGWWPTPLPDYGFPRIGAAIGYILSAFLGICLIVFLLWMGGRWLMRKNASSSESPVPEHISATRSEGFLSRNIAGLSQALESAIVADDVSRKPGLLQGLDPRAKVACFLLLVVTAGLLHSLALLAVLFMMALVLAYFSRISLSFFLKRVLLFIPLFTVVIAVPALFTTPGNPLWYIGSHVSVTQQGLLSAAFLCVRVTDSLSLGILLILTTRWTDLLAALRWFRLPALVVSIVGMTYRYIFLFLHTTNNMFMARRSRTIARFSGAANRRWLGQALAATLAKSQHMSEEVYLAMLSRGYSGEVIALDDLQARRRDLLCLVSAVLIIFILLWVNYR
jgi:cobalt/nickel transport system permease protein